MVAIEAATGIFVLMYIVGNCVVSLQYRLVRGREPIVLEAIWEASYAVMSVNHCGFFLFIIAAMHITGLLLILGPFPWILAFALIIATAYIRYVLMRPVAKKLNSELETLGYIKSQDDIAEWFSKLRLELYIALILFIFVATLVARKLTA